ncbi:efflux RND transporter periplasmic adaptor subunit [uncultured Megamonas sp.]|uniref:efflux RND transporter periplasmic adaptor subunit n=3 Tax=uncultured Megamonas sp. TaxID=286140 RepID=UPI0025F1F45D|nr:efflux RND transporter periplasmic adaptor subunit [uncultured Megamonas sp.]
MKKYFYIGLAIVLLLAISIIFYGAYLNSRGENIIANRMDNRHIALKGQVATTRNIQPVLNMDTIKLYSDKMADAVALIDGTITNAYVKRNSTVQAGDLMFSLVNEEIPLKISQADSDISKANVELKRAKNTYERYNQLMSMNATSAEKLDEVEAAYNAAIANVENLQMQKEQLLIQQSRQNILAPIDGEVLLLYRQPGSYVTMGTPIALVGDFSKLYFSQTINDADISRFSINDQIELIFQENDLQKSYDTDYAVGNLGNQQTFIAHIIDITPSLNEPAAMRKILFEIDNTVHILEPQSYRNVKLQVKQDFTCLTIPLTAMLSQEQNSVFVLNADNTIQRREVVTGVNDGKYIEIISGLSEGDIVITSDTNGLKDGTKVDITMDNEE